MNRIVDLWKSSALGKLVLLAGVLFALFLVCLILNLLLPPSQSSPPAADVIAIQTQAFKTALASLAASMPAPLPTVIPVQPSQPDPAAQTAQSYMAQFGGDLGAYTEILSLTDCAALQAKFDTASENNARETPGTQLFRVTLGYMTAADDRLRSLGCY